MSIRLRLTLLYTAILALTLTGFGMMLYGTQSQSMRSGEERMLAETARRLAELRQFEEHRMGDRRFRERPVPPWPPEGEDAPDRAGGEEWEVLDRNRVGGGRTTPHP
jgi:hypothetical protein